MFPGFLNHLASELSLGFLCLLFHLLKIFCCEWYYILVNRTCELSKVKVVFDKSKCQAVYVYSVSLCWKREDQKSINSFFGFVISQFTKSWKFIIGIPSSHGNSKLPFSTHISFFKLKVCMCTFPSSKYLCIWISKCYLDEMMNRGRESWILFFLPGTAITRNE